MKGYKRYSQNDPRWSKIRLGRSVLTIGGYGCLVTCIAMACGKSPKEVAKTLEFTDSDHPLGGGLLIWNQEENFNKLGLHFETRNRTFGKLQEELVEEQCGMDGLIPILEVETKRGGSHWVLPIGRALTWRGYGWAVNDPWDGSRQWKTVGLGAPYNKIKGFALFSYKRQA